ncbi:MAG: hypothetical protein KJ676_14495 [Alphaproteobacteria bacterium]|nr:hypothetical protein [Alphaproteobacteria bacterium]MBU1526763.1 hypothetical protein [Alphaproteobacteria bacterium]MBU2116268.1 hypothetical protein [Alphaproteobacteria bacterium]MBU2350114.1 hypothetical protein [Alphaproteobacteria bacterium]MBU2383067.1 hypothetical protein [Alphaproteobacteria bacterium]
MTDPTDPRHPGDPEPPDPFPEFGSRPVFSPFPPLEPTPAASGEPVAEALVVPPAAAVTTPEPDPPSDWNEKADAHDLIERDNRLKAMARFAFPPGPPPDDEGLAARDRRWTTRVILVVALFMAIFNAGSVPNWSRQQAPGWVTDTVRGMSEVWATQVALLGADLPRQGARDAYEAARDMEWVGRDGAAEVAPAA